MFVHSSIITRKEKKKKRKKKEEEKVRLACDVFDILATRSRLVRDVTDTDCGA